MERRTLARWLVFAALGCFGFLAWAGSATAQEATVVQGQNTSTDSDATSDTATAQNALTFNAGPAAGADGAPAQAAQNGDNAGTVSQDAAAHSGDAAAGSTVAGAVGGGATVQVQNTSDGAIAESGPATAANDGAYVLGPEATSVDALAQASQVGDNRLDASQTVGAATGDAVAGSQVVGIVSNGDNEVQSQNSATDPVAVSGAVDAFNLGDLALGPNAFADQAEASASQIGDNDAVLTQSNEASSGDAVAGSFVTGIVGNGSSTVQGQSSSTDAAAFSGDVESENLALAVVVGPTARAFDDQAQSSQVGDNSAEIDQDVRAHSGDAVAGSQITGLVTEQAGHLSVQNQQSSEGDTAFSGTVGLGGVENLVEFVQVGPTADAIFAPASATQNGDNDLGIAQSADLASGDAVAGSQVTGAVGATGEIQQQNTSTDSFAFSGDVALGSDTNVVTGAVAGPFALAIFEAATASQVGDNELLADQVAALASGDAVAGAQITGAIGGDVTVQNQNTSDNALALSGFVLFGGTGNVNANSVAGPFAIGVFDEASASQIGDNTLATGQSADLASGDAVAGSQVTGVIAGSSVLVQNQNDSVDDFAFTGDVGTFSTINLVEEALAGPLAVGEFGAATAVQNGSNGVAVDQQALLASGDAVAGSQVTGAVADGGDVSIQGQNSSDTSTSVSGDVAFDVIVNEVDLLTAGPEALAFDEDASASQIGDNDAVIGQLAEAYSGDAVAGSQVIGTAGGDATVQTQNAAVDAVAVTGDATATNAANGINVGALAVADGGEATASQIGDNALALGQHASVSSGDAVAGSQVIGTVHGDVLAQLQNFDDASIAETFEADADNFATGQLGAVAESTGDTASSSQLGDSILDAGQAADAHTGDAVAGSQVIGVATSGSTALSTGSGLAPAATGSASSFELSAMAAS